MALTDEQRSMLQLLLGGQSYDDIASLLGIGADEVRSRSRAALQEIGGADPDAQVALSDYILGQADPIGRADAVRHLQNDPDANALAASLVAQLRLLSPQAGLPEIPAPRGRRAPAPEPPRVQTPSSGVPGSPPVPAQPTAPAAAGESRLGRVGGALGRAGDAFRGIGSSKRNSQLAIGVGALVLLLVVGGLAIAGVFEGGDGDGSDEQTASVPGDANLTVVRLAPLGGDSGAEGQAVFAQAQDQPLIQVNLSGLEPAPEGQNYIVWLYSEGGRAFPLARDQVGDSGNLTGAAPIPVQLASLIGNGFNCIDVSLASNAEAQRALAQAAEAQDLPQHVGDSILRGQIPSAPGEQAPSGADSQCGAIQAPDGGGQGGGGAGGGGQNGQ
jgi:hypothetical protein